MRAGLKFFRELLACLALLCLLGGCTNMIANGMVRQYAVAYPMRSPEYVLRDLGGNRYLLGQWLVPLNANATLQVRYYDRNTGLLTTLPSAVAAYRREPGTDLFLGAVRYESDSPMQIAFFENTDTFRTFGCVNFYKSAVNPTPDHPCGMMSIVLSLDGGHSFAWRRIRIPPSMGYAKPTSDAYEFAFVRNNTLYLGMYVRSGHSSSLCCYSDDGKKLDGAGVAYARVYEGKALASGSGIVLAVLAMPLPDTGGKPLPADQIPKDLSANLLIGPAFLAFDPGLPMARLETQPGPWPEPPRGHYTRADRQAYIESLRADYPQWAAHQTLDGLPLRQQWMSSDEIYVLRQKHVLDGDDPIEWVRLDRSAAK